MINKTEKLGGSISKTYGKCRQIEFWLLLALVYLYFQLKGNNLK